MAVKSRTKPTPSLANLSDELAKLPGIGPKSAQRIAHHLIRIPKEQALALAEAVTAARENTKLCSACRNLAEEDPCLICSDPQRDHTTICVVEDPADIAAMESTFSYKGLYHVLHGALAPVHGITPAELRIDALAQRLHTTGATELVLATNPSVEGEATATYIATHLARQGLRITRLARGLSTGSSVDSADRNTLKSALQGRQELIP